MKTRQSLSKKLKDLNIKITKEMRDIIHGYVMSDGYIKVENQLQVQQGGKQAQFVDWLYDKLKPLCTDNPPRKDKRGSMRFDTRALCNGFKAMWYEEEHTNSKGEIIKRRKRLPKSIACFFSPVFITLWYAGDGTQLDYHSVKFEVTCFTAEERLTLQALFKSKYNITTQINKAGFSKTGTQQWTLQIPAGEYTKFRAIITQIDLIPTVFPYKLYKDKE